MSEFICPLHDTCNGICPDTESEKIRYSESKLAPEFYKFAMIK